MITEVAPRKLTNDQQEQLEQILHQPPTEAGYDVPAWSPSLVRQHLEETFGVDYSLPSCRRMMKEAGLSYQKPYQTTASSSTTNPKKRWKMDATGVCIDQTKQSEQVEPHAVWFLRGARPSVELSGQRDWTCLLEAITEDGDQFFYRFDEYVTAKYAKCFILALYNEFRDDLIVTLDSAPYYRASVATGRQVRGDLTLARLPCTHPDSTRLRSTIDS